MQSVLISFVMALSKAFATCNLRPEAEDFTKRTVPLNLDKVYMLSTWLPFETLLKTAMPSWWTTRITTEVFMSSMFNPPHPGQQDPFGHQGTEASNGMTWEQDSADAAATPALLLWSRLVQ
jgi:hypothetical protein